MLTSPSVGLGLFEGAEGGVGAGEQDEERHAEVAVRADVGCAGHGESHYELGEERAWESVEFWAMVFVRRLERWSIRVLYIERRLDQSKAEFK